jgi:DNA-binding protein
MSQEIKSKVIVVTSADASASVKVTDIVERIISEIMQKGEADMAGVGDAVFLACSAMNMATEIAKVHIDDISIGNLELPSSRAAAVLAHLSQKPLWNYADAAAQEEKTLENIDEQTVSVSRAATMERLLTISLLRLAKFDKIRVVAAGGSINDAVVLALMLTKGQIAKDAVGVKLVHLYSISMRNDPTKSIAAMSIYLQKGITTEWTKRQSELLKRLSEK